MEIQTIQEALAGAQRVGEFLELPTRLETSEEAGEKVMTGAWQSQRGLWFGLCCGRWFGLRCGRWFGSRCGR